MHFWQFTKFCSPKMAGDNCNSLGSSSPISTTPSWNAPINTDLQLSEVPTIPWTERNKLRSSTDKQGHYYSHHYGTCSPTSLISCTSLAMTHSWLSLYSPEEGMEKEEWTLGHRFRFSGQRTSEHRMDKRIYKKTFSWNINFHIQPQFFNVHHLLTQNGLESTCT